MNNFTENIILIPIYNDWKSLNRLLIEINHTLDDTDFCNLLIVCSIKFEQFKQGMINEISIYNFKLINILIILGQPVGH